MALSASGSSGSRRQNSAYSLTGIGDTLGKRLAFFKHLTRLERIHRICGLLNF